MLASEFGTGQVFLSMLYFFLFFIWIWLLIVVFSDIFRSHDMGGFAKFLWIVFLVVLPFLGILIYLVARGHAMTSRQMAAATTAKAQQDAYIRSVAGSGAGLSAADQIASAKALLDSGAITQAEFDALKAKALR
jgi:hypothetical protein